MISYHSNCFQVVINMSEVPIALYPPSENGEDCSIGPRSFYK